MQRLVEKAKVKKSIQQNIPYGMSLYRSGDARGGFAIPPELIAVGAPILSDVLKRPINKLFDWMGLGAGFQAGDTPTYVPPYYHAAHTPGLHSASKRDLKNLRVLEHKLMPLSTNPEAFMRKLKKIHAKGEAWLKKHRKAMKKAHKSGKVGKGSFPERNFQGKSVKKYKHSKRYKTLKLKHYTKYPKDQFGKYHGCAKYKKHKAVYRAHRQKKNKS